MDVLNDKRFQEFIGHRALKSNTIVGYQRHMLFYCQVAGLTPSELITEADEDDDNGIRLRDRRLKKHLEDYMDWMEAEGFAISRIRIAVGIVKGFYRNFDIDIPSLKKLKKVGDNGGHTDDVIPCMDDIRHALKFVRNVRYRAIILLMMSSGMGRAEVLSLSVRDFIDGCVDYLDEMPLNDPVHIGETLTKLLSMGDVVPTYKLVRVKTGYHYFTFGSVESTHAICFYLLQNLPQTMDQPLFTNSNGKPMTGNSFEQYFYRINTAAGFEKKDSFGFFRSHNLRAFFSTTLMNPPKEGYRMSKNDIDRLMGHVVNTQDDRYFKASPSRLKEDYLRVMKYLTTEEVKVKRIETREYRELVERLQTMEEKDRKNEAMMKIVMDNIKNRDPKFVEEFPELFGD